MNCYGITVIYINRTESVGNLVKFPYNFYFRFRKRLFTYAHVTFAFRRSPFVDRADIFAISFETKKSFYFEKTVKLLRPTTWACRLPSASITGHFSFRSYSTRPVADDPKYGEPQRD